MNKFVVSLIETMSLNQIRNIFTSLDKSKKDSYCLYIQKIRDDLGMYCKQLKR